MTTDGFAVSGSGTEDAPFDVAFVGSGLSGTFALIRVLERLIARRDSPARRLVTIERSGEFHAGVPYGHRSGTNAFLITNLDSFMPMPERPRFEQWLTDNRGWMFDAFQEGGGELSQAWLDRYATQIVGCEWGGLYLPRYLVGLYLRDRVEDLLAEASAAGVADHFTLIGEVADLIPTDDGYQICSFSDGPTVRSRTVVLGLGMPAAQRFGFPSAACESPICLIDDPYDPGVTVAMEQIERCLVSTATNAKAEVLIIGGNASALEMIFRLVDNDRIRPLLGRIWVTSPSGVLPRRLIPPNPLVKFDPTHMDALHGCSIVTAQDIHHAMRADIEAGDDQALAITDTLAPIFGRLGALLARLDREEKSAFATTWGLKLVRLQRRAGADFSDMIDALVADDRLRVLPGAFIRVESSTDEGATFVYQAEGDETGRAHPTPMRAIVNCTGSASLHGAGSRGLVETLVARGIVQLNDSGRGVVVDDALRANHGLFVLGPLMSGNVIGDAPVWHMEDCGRIMSYAGLLAESVAAPDQSAVAAR